METTVKVDKKAAQARRNDGRRVTPVRKWGGSEGQSSNAQAWRAEHLAVPKARTALTVQEWHDKVLGLLPGAKFEPAGAGEWFAADGRNVVGKFSTSAGVCTVGMAEYAIVKPYKLTRS